MKASRKPEQKFASAIELSFSMPPTPKRARRALVPCATRSAEPATAEREHPARELTNPMHEPPDDQSSAEAAKPKRRRQAIPGTEPTLSSPAGDIPQTHEISEGQADVATHAPSAFGNSGGQDLHPRGADVPPAILELLHMTRLRRRWLKAELKLVLQGQAICRSYAGGCKDTARELYAQAEAGDNTDPELFLGLLPIFEALKPLRDHGSRYDRALAKLARGLPVWPWAKATWGLSDAGLAKIVGEAGDIGRFRSVSGLWSYLGLAPYKGRAGSTCRAKGGLTAEEWEVLGYSPARRSVMWNIGNSLVGGMGKGVRPAVGEDWQAREDWSPYQKLYVGRLIHEAARDPENMARPATAAGKLSFSLHAHNRAKRYVEKRALRDLWRAWRAAERGHRVNDIQVPFASLGDLPMAAE